MRRVLFIFVLCLAAITTQAQAKLGYFIEGNIQISPKQHGLTALADNLIAGIEPVENLRVMFDLSGMLGLYNKEGVKTYYQTGVALGGGLGYRVWTNKKTNGLFAGRDAVDVRAIFTTTAGKPDWKYNNYSIGLTLYDRDSHKISPTLGIGYHYIKSRTPGISNQSNVYFEIGLRI